jgi:hypothetical protein
VLNSINPADLQRNGQEWIRTTEGISQQIYSLPRLATSVPTRLRCSRFAVCGSTPPLNSLGGEFRELCI